MKRILYAGLFILFTSGCTKKLFPDNTLGQNSSKGASGGVIYPDGSIHYPDGSVKTTDGMIWPAQSTGNSNAHSGTIADDPNVTVVSRRSTTAKDKQVDKEVFIKKARGKTVVNKKQTTAVPGEDEVDVGTINSSGSNEISFPGYDAESKHGEPVQKTKQGEINTSARKDATGRHARKRGESYLRK